MNDILPKLRSFETILEQNTRTLWAAYVREAIAEIESLRAQIEGQDVGQPHPTSKPTMPEAV